MIFSYKAIDQNNASREGTVDASNIDAAISTIQKRGYTIISIEPIEQKTSFYNIEIDWFQRISNKEVVILSRQLATLFDAQVSALRIFRLLAAEAQNTQLQKSSTTLLMICRQGVQSRVHWQRTPRYSQHFT